MLPYIYPFASESKYFPKPNYLKWNSLSYITDTDENPINKVNQMRTNFQDLLVLSQTICLGNN